MAQLAVIGGTDVAELAARLAMLEGQLKEAQATPINAPEFRGKTDADYAAERVEIRHHGYQVHARRMAKQVAKHILAQGLAQYCTLNNNKIIRDKLKMYGVAEAQMAYAVELVKAFVEA